ncbi:odorant receptor 63a-like [Drosophila busckii]|uniref:odorant receptor 63a-like n=1 Tax=Drosophila busckii TaxID=30019 RepID=UPI00083EF00C|nr:odorant receptor 63a-like [Drosophila busckii]
MYTSEEAAAVEQRNYHNIKEVVRVNYTIGYNLRRATRWDWALRLWSVLLILGSFASFYGHWNLFVRYVATDLSRISESVSTVFQTLMSVVKMVYFLLAPRKFYELVRRCCCHQLLQDCELFECVKQLPLASQLRQHIEQLMQACWTSTRRQLLYYLTCCCGILLNYYITALAVNIYQHYQLNGADYEVMLPLPALYPGCMDKGMTFPYYHIPMLLETFALYICGMGAFGFDVIFIVLCLHCVGLMQSLCHMIECATASELPRELRVQYLRCCIYQYQRVAAFALELNACFRQIILIQFLLSLLVWGLVLFQMSVGIASSFLTTLRMFMYLAAGGYQIVIYCYNGQLFASAAEQIPKAFYECNWHEESQEFRQLVRMMIMRSNRSFKLDVSWFSTMTLPTLMSMVRTSGQYYLLLQNIMEK